MPAVFDWLCLYWWVPFFFCLVFGGGIFAGAKSLIEQWQRARRKERDTDLKRDMVAKGFSPAEIERVIQARPGAAMPAGAVDDIRLPKHLGQGFDSGAEKANLVAALAEQGMEAEDIEHILKTLGESAGDELPSTVAAVHRLAEQGMDADGIERVIRALRPPATPRGKDETTFKE
jgi:hypothetical protein